LSATLLRFRIEDWQAYVSETAERRSVAGGATEAAAGVPTLLRRRVSAIGQKALRAAFQLSGTASPRFVFCSRHGEFDRTVSLLRSIAAREPVSPADFSLSVHNALAGLLSIATRNPRGHTAIAAGPDSFGFGMLDGALCLATESDEKVLVVYFDTALPEIYGDVGDDRAAPLALALLLAPGQGDAGDVVMSYAAHEGEVPSARPDRDAAAILAFLRADRDELRIDGTQMDWRWARVG
jgi:hypothetical protein